MAYFKELKDDELYLYLNGKLIYKRWIKTGESKVFDVMAFDKYTEKSIRDPKLEAKEKFLDENLFYGLTDINTGFDAPYIRYFSAEDFKIVLQRCEKLGIGIYGIEPWLNGSYYDVIAFNSPLNAQRYNAAFEKFLKKGKDLQYSATYYIPEELM
ncbi:MAG: hypothetical protein ACO1N0_15615 [Fluviicola sp.]